MQLEWFHSFLEVSKHKSLTKASEKLNITQPALSKIIRNLERELDVALFQRTVTGMELTVAGIRLHEGIKPILEEIHGLMNDLKSINEYSQLKIAVLPSIATYYLASKMSSIYESFADTQLIVGNSSDEALQSLLIGDVQVAIGERRKSTSRHFWQSLLFEEPYYCIFPNGSRFCESDSLNMLDIIDEPLVVYPSNCDIRAAIVRNYKEYGATAKISMEIPFSESIFAFVGEGAGITIAPKIIADQSHRYGLKTLQIADFQEKRKIYITARSLSVGKSLQTILQRA